VLTESFRILYDRVHMCSMYQFDWLVLCVTLTLMALYYSGIYPMLLFMLTARPIEALPYAKGCLLFVGWALRRQLCHTSVGHK